MLFRSWTNGKIAIIALLGMTAGQAVIWYSGQFYARLFLVNTLKVPANTADEALIIALLIATGGFIFFGWLSDKIGRKPIIMAGCLLGAVTYQWTFGMITSVTNPALEAALSEQRHDLGLTEQREPPPGCQLSTLLVADEVCVLPPGHALAERRVITPADLAGQSFISLAPTDPYRQQVDAVFAQAGVARQLQLETPSALSVCALVRQGLGVAIVNPLTALGMVDTMRNEGHRALVHTVGASNLGQMLNRICLKDGIGLVNIVRKPEQAALLDRKSTRLNSSHTDISRMPSSA